MTLGPSLTSQRQRDVGRGTRATHVGRMYHHRVLQRRHSLARAPHAQLDTRGVSSFATPQKGTPQFPFARGLHVNPERHCHTTRSYSGSVNRKQLCCRPGTAVNPAFGRRNIGDFMPYSGLYRYQNRRWRSPGWYHNKLPNSPVTNTGAGIRDYKSIAELMYQLNR
jgi:hypothetical protein